MRGFASLLMLCLFGACSDAPEEAARERTKRTRQLAEQGDPRAQFQLAQMYRTGDGLEKDLSQAVAWYRKAAEQGLPIAQHNLAVALDHGQGIAENKAGAAKWYRRAAAQGQVSSQYILARLLLLGQGGERDPAEAAHWFRRAAQTGHRDSIYHLGLMNRDGLGMPRNLVLSGKWLILAAKLGKLEAQGAYHTIASDLTPQQRQVAERLANEEQALLNRAAPVPMAQLAPRAGRLVHRGTGQPYTGRALLHHPNGTRAREIELQAGLPHGWETIWFPDSRPASHTRFKNGQRDGLVEEWYRNGQLRLRGTNHAHRLLWATSFSADGNATGQVLEGNGTLVIHHLNGTRASEHLFVEGNRTITRRWDAQGKPLD
jgi:hypothetical protein